VFCFDGDTPAARRPGARSKTASTSWPTASQLSFLFLPQGEDPDTYVRKLGKDAFETLLNEAKPLSQFLLDELKSHIDLATGEGRAALLRKRSRWSCASRAPFLGRIIRQSLAQIAGLEIQDLEREYGIKTARTAQSAPPRREAAEDTQSGAPGHRVVDMRPQLHVLADRRELARARESHQSVLMKCNARRFARSVRSVGQHARWRIFSGHRV